MRLAIEAALTGIAAVIVISWLGVGAMQLILWLTFGG